jgi:hypothetical protein
MGCPSGAASDCRTVSLVMMLRPVKSAMTCNTDRTSTFWKLSESFSPLAQLGALDELVRIFWTDLTSRMNRLSV